MRLPENIQMSGNFEIKKTGAKSNPMLLKAIKQAFVRQHIYICAPPGFGKSAAAARWLKSIPGAKVWIELARSDNALEVFYERMTAAFLSIRPDNAALIERLREEEFENYHHLAMRAAYYLSSRTTKTYVVLDSFEHITCEPLMESMISIIRELPEAYSFVLIDRQEPHGLFSDLILRNLMSVIKNTEIII